MLDGDQTTVRGEFFNLLFFTGIDDKSEAGQKADDNNTERKGSEGFAGPHDRPGFTFDQLASMAQQYQDSELQWENELQRVRLVDKKYTGPAKTNGVDGANISASLEAIAKSLQAMNEAKETPAPAENTKPAEDKNAGASSQGLSPAAIAGIVLGILALLIGGGVAVAYHGRRLRRRQACASGAGENALVGTKALLIHLI